MSHPVNEEINELTYENGYNDGYEKAWIDCKKQLINFIEERIDLTQFKYKKCV